MADATVDFLFNNALQLQRLGRLAEAEQGYRCLLARQPKHPGAILFLGTIALFNGRHEVALELITEAIALDPKQPSAYSNLGLVLHAMGRYEEAIVQYHRAIALRPNESIFLYNLANAQCRVGKLVEAIENYQQAIRLKPECFEAYNNLGDLLKNMGELDAALVAFRQAISIKPDFQQAYSNLLLSLHYHHGIDAKVIADEHLKWGRRAKTASTANVSPHPNIANPDSRLRIGYLSADFRTHAVPRFLLQLLQNHDREVVEVFAYAQSHVTDSVTTQIRSLTDAWRNLRPLSDAQVAAQIRQDQIDILVDLSGHTADNRLTVFAHKPAPVQVTYLGYPNSTGLRQIDYRLTDAFADPPGTTDQWYTEKLFRLFPSAWCFSPAMHTPLPQRAAGPITFGSFNTFAKITDPILALWSRILQSTPRSRLLLKAEILGSVQMRKQVQDRLARFGIDPTRLDLRGQEAQYQSHLALYGSVDIALDTFPYHGTTTTCEAMWMGVPVLTLAGASHWSRVGVSLLSNVGHPELIAETDEHYVRLAVDLAHDRPRLNHLHSTLRQQMEQSPLMDGPAFTRNIESAFRQMWTQYCNR